MLTSTTHLTLIRLQSCILWESMLTVHASVIEGREFNFVSQCLTVISLHLWFILNVSTQNVNPSWNTERWAEIYFSGYPHSIYGHTTDNESIKGRVLIQNSFHFTVLNCSHLRVLIELWIKFESNVLSVVFGSSIPLIFIAMLNAVEPQDTELAALNVQLPSLEEMIWRDISRKSILNQW